MSNIQTVRDLGIKVKWIPTEREGLVIDMLNAGGCGKIYGVEFISEDGEVETKMIHENHLEIL